MAKGGVVNVMVVLPDHFNTCCIIKTRGGQFSEVPLYIGANSIVSAILLVYD